MVDFDVPVDSGWGKRFREKHGDAINDDVQVVSPAFRHVVLEKAQRSQAIHVPSKGISKGTNSSIGDAVAAEIEQIDKAAEVELATSS